ncbi:hypothetical protein THUN1379_11440 [Paludibacterium sp. THUN1379]|uniref:hypothetical protein n=1 Tax=Paludibacterium sp. THUN1379 TaxID=3112107 RepID=UPI003090C24A|nr:hypothetical protein THUN1379_11440 [Paludibacterium sp. THUN1379]
MHPVTETIQRLYQQHGGQYDGEAVSQADHAIQGAMLAREAGEPRHEPVMPPEM